MKTAEEIVHYLATPINQECSCHLCGRVRMVLRDAKHSGMIEAAEIVGSLTVASIREGYGGAFQCKREARQAILTAAQKLKEGKV